MRIRKPPFANIRVFFLCSTLLAAHLLAADRLGATAHLHGGQITDETYDRVLDLLFSEPDATPHRTVYSFELRFRPYSEPESQITIRKKVDRIEIIEFVSDSGIISNKLREYLTKFNDDPTNLAKSVRIRKRMLSLKTNSQLKAWHDSFFLRLARTNHVLREAGNEFDRTGGKETLLLHGGTYRVRYQQRLNTLMYDLHDADIRDAKREANYSLLTWMAMVQKVVRGLREVDPAR